MVPAPTPPLVLNWMARDTKWADAPWTLALFWQQYRCEHVTWGFTRSYELNFGTSDVPNTVDLSKNDDDEGEEAQREGRSVWWSDGTRAAWQICYIHGNSRVGRGYKSDFPQLGVRPANSARMTKAAISMNCNSDVWRAPRDSVCAQNRGTHLASARWAPELWHRFSDLFSSHHPSGKLAVSRRFFLQPFLNGRPILQRLCKNV